MGQSLIGIECILYMRNSGAIGDALSAASFSSNFTKLSKLKNVRGNIEWSRANVSTRASKFAAKRPALAEFSIEADSVWKPDDAQLEALMAAAWAGTEIELLLADGPAAPVATEKVRRCSCYVFSLSDDQPLEDAEALSWGFEPSETLPPERVVMPS